MTSVAEILAFPRPREVGPMQLADAIAEGLPVRSADAIKRLVEPLGRGTFHRIVPEASLRRARQQNKPLSRDASERLYDVARVFAEAENVFGDRDKAVRFMQRPNMMLSMRTPFDVARSSTAGAQAVIELLGQARAGVAV
jgi:putative toxin-antitoxin system antitoxin component (TIGR02293 family)